MEAFNTSIEIAKEKGDNCSDPLINKGKVLNIKDKLDEAIESYN